MRLAKILSLSGLLFAAYPTAAKSASIVSETFLDTLRQVESDGGKKLVGDDGKALGPYQFHRAAWDYVRGHLLSYTESFYDFTYSWCYVSDEEISRVYAKRYCAFIERELWKHKIQPTPERIYAAYNYGYHRVIRVSGHINLLPLSVQSKVQRFRNELDARLNPSHLVDK